jgi:thiol-disulfide isomerase/thioredoxin
MMKYKIHWLVLAAFVLTACSGQPGIAPVSILKEKVNMALDQETPSPAAATSQFPDLGPAPELENTVWLNTDRPLRLKDLRGKVVLLEMWTFGCINCQHVIPSLKEWDQKYASQWLVIIGNHFPEFAYERDLANLKDALAQDGIKYPVAQDNDGKTWSAYHNQYWPTAYLIDKRGHIRYVHIGEGNYALTEEAIQELLAEPAS